MEREMEQEQLLQIWVPAGTMNRDSNDKPEAANHFFPTPGGGTGAGAGDVLPMGRQLPADVPSRIASSVAVRNADGDLGGR